MRHGGTLDVNGLASHGDQCPLSGVTQTSQFMDVTSANDPKRTFAPSPLKEKAPDDAGALNFFRSD
jgi:hypothetical protein